MAAEKRTQRCAPIEHIQVSCVLQSVEPTVVIPLHQGQMELTVCRHPVGKVLSQRIRGAGFRMNEIAKEDDSLGTGRGDEVGQTIEFGCSVIPQRDAELLKRVCFAEVRVRDKQGPLSTPEQRAIREQFDLFVGDNGWQFVHSTDIKYGFLTEERECSGSERV